MGLELAALHAALGLAARPTLVDHARLAALPAGMSLLLEIAAGDKEAIKRCVECTNASEGEIRAASEFYIEQVMLSERHDSYRTLGADRFASSATLRRNMALLMRWLHPDVAAQSSHGARIDRTVFAERVAAAWEDLKTEERRFAYDAQVKTEPKESDEAVKPSKFRRAKHRWATGRPKASKKVGRKKPDEGRIRRSSFKKRTTSRRLKVVPMLQDTWITRMLNVFRRDR